MEIGRLEYFATKPDINGKFYGKIYPYSQTLRNSIDDGLVFFHESCIPRTSALRTDQMLQGYKYKSRLRGKTVYVDPVYVAFDMPRKQTSRRGNKAATVMLLEEADPDELPDLATVEGADVRVALISAFPSIYTLSRIGLDSVHLDQVTQLKACWDGSSGDERIAFVRSLDSAALEKALIHLIGIDKKESLSLASPYRTRLALAARPDAVLIPEVAARLTPGMWMDQFLVIMGDPDKRIALMSSAQPPFRAYALAKFAEQGGSLEGDLADDFVAAVRGSAGAGIATECLRTVLAVQPRLALRDDISEMLTPELWVDELLGLMRNPVERSALLAHARPAFRACAVVMLVKSGGPLDEDAAHIFVTTARERANEEFAAKCLRRVIPIQPRLALMDDVAAMLTPDMWVDGLLGLMERPEDRRALLAAVKPEFHAYAVSRFVGAGGLLDEDDTEGFVAAVRACGGSELASECLTAVLGAQPRFALVDGVAAMLTPDTWVDGLLGLMERPEDRRALLAAAKPEFHAYAVSRFVGEGGLLDEDDTEGFAAAIREHADRRLAGVLLRFVLDEQPRIALVDGVAAMLTPDVWVDGLLELMGSKADMRTLLAHAQPAFRVYAIARYVEAGALLSEADVQDFLAAVRECEDENMAADCLIVVLASQPRIALADGVASMLTPDVWVDELLEIMGTPKEQMGLLSQAQPNFKTYAVKKLIEAGVDLDIGVLELCPLRSCPDLLAKVKWSLNDASYAETVGHWLAEARLCDAEGRKLVVSAAERMHETGDLLSPVMWMHLPAAVQTRLCVFWSNHCMDSDGYAVRGGVVKLCLDARDSSWGGYDPAVKSALLLLSLPLWTNPKDVFLDANDSLIGEIVRQFNDCDAENLQSFELSDELQALLQRCTSYQYVDDWTVRGFCDGRAWSKNDGTMSVWCHAGTDRPEGGRRECKSLLSPINASDGGRRLRSNPEDQFMADLLANVNEAMGVSVDVGPWLGSRGSMDLVEYAYRVSGYVNKLVSALPHMVCRKCGARLRLNYKYPREGLYARSLDLPALSGPALSGTVCSCPNVGDGGLHDEDVYIHYCLNCHRVIDSRECKMRDVKADGSPGLYLCMYCGASAVFRPATACPSCGNTDLSKLRYYRGSMTKEERADCGSPSSGEILIACKRCMYDARGFRSEFE